MQPCERNVNQTILKRRTDRATHFLYAKKRDRTEEGFKSCTLSTQTNSLDFSSICSTCTRISCVLNTPKPHHHHGNRSTRRERPTSQIRYHHNYKGWPDVCQRNGEIRLTPTKWIDRNLAEQVEWSVRSLTTPLAATATTLNVGSVKPDLASLSSEQWNVIGCLLCC